MLEGIRVLDFTRLLPGPYATLQLADLGAEVIRVEWPKRPDLVRFFPPFVDEHNQTSAAHAWLNRGKKLLSVDMEKPEAIALLKELALSSDVLIEQFKPGVMKRLGLDYETLKAEKPDLVYCSISSFGQEGPYANKGGHDINFMALAGGYSYVSQIDGQLPVNPIQVADLSGSLHASGAVMAGLIQKLRTGKGSFLDISLHDCALAMNGLSAASALGSRASLKAGEEVLAGGSFYGLYQTADGKWLSVGGLEPVFIEGMVELFDCPELKVAMNLFDRDAQKKARALLTDLIRQKTQAEWCQLLEGKSLCIEPVLDYKEVAEDPHLRERGMVREVNGVTQIGSVINPASGIEKAQIGGKMGADTESILKALGHSPDAIAQLTQAGVIFT